MIDKDFKFKTPIARSIFYQKYAISQADTWPERCRTIVEDVCGTMSGRRRRKLSVSECQYLTDIMTEMKFLPGGRYIYYAGRSAHYFSTTIRCITDITEYNMTSKPHMLCIFSELIIRYMSICIPFPTASIYLVILYTLLSHTFTYSCSISFSLLLLLSLLWRLLLLWICGVS